MAKFELRIPNAGESISEVEVGTWFKQEGEGVKRDERVVEISTDKASMELPAPVEGTLVKIVKQKGEVVRVGEVIAVFSENGAGAQPMKSSPAGAGQQQSERSREASGKPPTPAAEATSRLGPAARKALRENQHPDYEDAPVTPAPTASQPKPVQSTDAKPVSVTRSARTDRGDEIVPMTLLRRKIAERLVEAQQKAALLTTFNEIDLFEVTRLRKSFQEAFLEKHQVKLGFMSFFIKAVVEALKEVPQVNAEIRGTDIVYHHYFDIGVAVGSGRGLVVPVIRDADRLSFADLEKTIADFGKRARENRLHVDELQGGTFTISNGGIYGSMLSTPIVNPPQSGILGMHAIQERPVVRNGEIVIRPMMYVALTYDHRLVDGREAVTFLKRIKDLLEDPARLLLEV